MSARRQLSWSAELATIRADRAPRPRSRLNWTPDRQVDGAPMWWGRETEFDSLRAYAFLCGQRFHAGYYVPGSVEPYDVGETWPMTPAGFSAAKQAAEDALARVGGF